MKPNLDEFILANQNLTSAEIARQTGWARATVVEHRQKLNIPNPNAQSTPREEVDKDRKVLVEKRESVGYKKKYETLLEYVETVEAERDAVKKLDTVKTFQIKLPSSKTASHATAVVLASDWHYEEKVESEAVNGYNEFNLKVADKRIDSFFQNVVRLVTQRQQHIAIDNLVLALLGDFISGSIHDELMEGNQLLPIDALVKVQNRIASGIEFILEHTKLTLTVPCHSGNHGRSTHKQRISTEAGNSFEYYMYHQLANHFRNEKRVTFIIPNGYHSYVSIGEYTIRFHHGHQMKYGGGVGGLFIPVRKAIGQWDKIRPADLDCFGHFHQSKFDTGTFICNGSLIGYSSYALSIKADPEPPSQTFFLVNEKRKQITDYCPVWLD